MDMTPIFIAGGVLLWLVGAIFSIRTARRLRAERAARGEVVQKPNRGVAVFVIGVIGFAFAVVLGPGLLAAHRHDQLVENGLPATATIVAVEETGYISNDRPEVELTLSVQPPEGQAFESREAWIFSIMDIQTYQVGATVDVYFDPADTDTVAVIGVTQEQNKTK